MKLCTSILILTLICDMTKINTASVSNNELSNTIREFNKVADKWTKMNTNVSTNNIRLLVYNDFEIMPTVKHDLDIIKSLPESFDPREKWTKCPSLNEIRDQGKCGSCWAIAPIAAMTDRICTYSNGTKNFHFSVEDVVTCTRFRFGCNGGHSGEAWKLWVDIGLVSGGEYGSSQGCKPYSFPTSPDHVATLKDFLPTPDCDRSCKYGYNVTYEDDRRRGKAAYKIEGEDHIKAELFKNGPVTAHMIVYEDLINYKSGVYKHVSGGYVFHHVIKILGWGVDNGTKYWLAANSWNTIWGENGFFKIIRGVDDCEIETSWVSAGEPLLEDY